MGWTTAKDVMMMKMMRLTAPGLGPTTEPIKT